MKRRLAFLAVPAAVVVVLAALDPGLLGRLTLGLPGGALALLVGLLVVNEVVKGARWAFMLRSSQLDIRAVDAVTSYLAAGSAAALPGSSMLTVRLAQEHGSVRMHQATAGLIGESMADLTALGLLGAAAVILTHVPAVELLVPAMALAAVAGSALGLRSRRVRHWATSLLGRRKFTRKLVPREEELLDRAALMMRPRALAGASAFSIVSTILSVLMLLTIAVGLSGDHIGPLRMLYVHTFSILERMVVPVPGGYGVGDASLAGMLSVVGLGLAQATLVALAHRSASTLVRTAIGFGVLGVRYPHLLTVPFEAIGALAHRLAPGRRQRMPLPLRFAPPARPAEITVDLPGIGD
ncbi:MAG TPA: lysylphosphatidylglycerol synthase transmembrane domain-containing protein [Thermomicrobiaceae bacterium]|nr:lysylphosphatidylglycerol synthase transmembrane domain-containing protein [Thermomicrobiaceae bacterium]